MSNCYFCMLSLNHIRNNANNSKSKVHLMQKPFEQLLIPFVFALRKGNNFHKTKNNNVAICRNKCKPTYLDRDVNVSKREISTASSTINHFILGEKRIPL